MTAKLIDFPYRFDGGGRTAEPADDDEHLRDLIEQVLFTAPGERVNRPTFGSGLMRLVFAPNSDAVAAAVQMSVQGALQQWLGDLLRVESVQLRSDDSTVVVTVQYVERTSRQRKVAQFTRSV